MTHPLAPVLTAAGVALLVLLSITLSRTVGIVSTLWGASGLAAAMWLVSGRGWGHDLAFGALVAVGFAAGQLLAGLSPALSLVFTVIDLLEVVLVVVLARRFAPNLELNSVAGAMRFIVGAALLAPAAAGLLGAAALSVMRGADFLHSFQTWWFADAAGIAIVGGIVLSAAALLRRTRGQPIAIWRIVEAVLLFGLLLAASIVIFWMRVVPVSFLIVPVLMLVTVRLKVFGAAVGLFIVAIAAIGGAVWGAGPFETVHVDPNQRILAAQMMILFGCLPMLLMASLLEERAILLERMQVAKQRVERESHTKSRLLANVAHEIKSPVGGIIGIGEMWASGQLGSVTAAQKDMAGALVSAAREIEHLSEDMLMVSSAQLQAPKLHVRPTDVLGVAEDVVRRLTVRPEARNAQIDIICDEAGLLASADSHLLAQALEILIGNALRHGSAQKPVQVMVRPAGACVRIEVIDHGPGLSLQKQAELFEPFNRSGLSRGEREGHGVGLTMARHMIERQNGAIGVNSSPGAGANFWIELPSA